MHALGCSRNATGALIVTLWHSWQPLLKDLQCAIQHSVMNGNGENRTISWQPDSNQSLEFVSFSTFAFPEKLQGSSLLAQVLTPLRVSFDYSKGVYKLTTSTDMTYLTCLTQEDSLSNEPSTSTKRSDVPFVHPEFRDILCPSPV